MSKVLLDRREVKEAVEIIKSVGVPSQPKIVHEIFQEINKEDPNATRIAQLISKDMGLSAKVLKIANSPFFNIKESVRSVDQALMVLGLKNFYNTVLSSTLRDSLNSRGVVSDHFWDHSMIVGTISAHIAKKTAAAPEEEAYMLGLFHDCSIALMLKRFSNYVQVYDMAIEQDKAAVLIEERRYNTNHCIAGFLVAKSWHLPDHICRVIQYHHEQNIDIHSDIEKRRLASILFLAEFCWLAYITNINSGKDSDEGRWVERHENIMFEMDLDIDDLKDFKEDTFDILSKLEDYN